MKNFIVSILFLGLAGFLNSAKACHPLSLVNPQFIPESSGLKVMAASDSPTCGCGTYWLEIQVFCPSSGPPPTSIGGVVNYVAMDGPETYTSQEMLKPNCILQSYPPTMIPWSKLAPGTQYHIRMAEHANGQVGPWTTVYTFTTPGTPLQSSFDLLASSASVCSGTPVTIYSNVVDSMLNFKHSWNVPVGGVFQFDTILSAPATFILTLNDLCASATYSDTITVGVTNNYFGNITQVSPACAGDSIHLLLNIAPPNFNWEYSENQVQWTIFESDSMEVFTPVLDSVMYVRVADSQCQSSILTIFGVPTASSFLTSNYVCAGDSFELSALGGDTYQWSPSDGLSSTSGQQIYALPSVTTTYTVTTTSLCGNAMSTVVVEIDTTIQPVTWNFNISRCTNGPTSILIGGTPSGGTYTGPGVSGNYFYPSVAGVGIHTLYYIFTHPNTCIDTATGTATVNVCTSIQEDSDKDIFVLTDEGRIIIDIKTESAIANVYAADGKMCSTVLLHPGRNQIERLPSGLYFMRISSSNRNDFMRKVLIN